MRGDELPLAMRIVHVARDATFQRMLGGAAHAASVVRGRSGHAFDPEVVAAFADEEAGFLAIDTASAWEETLAREPGPRTLLAGGSIDAALAAMGDFADLVSPCFLGHSAGVARLAMNAAQRCNFDMAEVTMIRRAALIHDIGR